MDNALLKPNDLKILFLNKKNDNNKEEIWCCVECKFGDYKYQTKFMTISPSSAKNFVENNFMSLSWTEKN